MIPINLPREQKDEIVKRLQGFFEDERSETIGDLAAEIMIDFMIKEVGPFIYNKAISDVRNFMDQKAMQIEEELYSMEQSIKTTR